MSTAEQLLEDALDEVFKAREKFPKWHGHKALVEEVGELAKALLDFEIGNATEADIWLEAKQVIAMVIRNVLDGEPGTNFAGIAKRPSGPRDNNLERIIKLGAKFDQ